MTKTTFLITLMAAVALPTLAVAPSAFAKDNNQYSHKKFEAVKKNSSSAYYRTPQRTEKNPENYRSNRRNANGDRSRRNGNNNNHTRRDGSRHYDQGRNDRHRNNYDRNRNHQNDWSYNDHDRDDWRRDARRRENWRRHRRDDWRRERRWERRRDRYWQRNHRHNYYRPWNTARYTGWNDRYYGYQTNYRSSLGISFIFGQPGYSRYRWAPSRYSLYRPEYTSYNSYQANTFCERVVIDGFHMGHVEQVSVMQCSNPYDGTYIVQGSEQVVYCRYS